MTLKDSVNSEINGEKFGKTEKIEETIERIDDFIKMFIEKSNLNNVNYDISNEKEKIFIKILKFIR